MEKIKTHYDNLQVTENASPEVIRGAYRYLSQKWHPDRNLRTVEQATRITQIINEAFAVLSDPHRRREHDVWIRDQRAAQAAKERVEPKSAREEPEQKAPAPASRIYKILRSGPMGILATSFAIGAIVAIVYSDGKDRGVPEVPQAERLAAITKDDVLRVARTYLRPDRMRVVVVGDSKVVGNDLANLGLGPVETRSPSHPSEPRKP